MPSRLNLSRQLRSTRGIAMKGQHNWLPGGINRIRLSECEDKSELVVSPYLTQGGQKRAVCIHVAVLHAYRELI